MGGVRAEHAGAVGQDHPQRHRVPDHVWRSGALFGTTPQEAFFVKCDAETNPPNLRELGQVVTEIGVAIVRPAEFVIFRISQFVAAAK